MVTKIPQPTADEVRAAELYKGLLALMRRKGLTVEDLTAEEAEGLLLLHQNAQIQWGLAHGYYEIEENG